MEPDFPADFRSRIIGLAKQLCCNVQSLILQCLPKGCSIAFSRDPHQLPFADKQAFGDIFCGKLAHEARIYQIVQP